MDQLIIQGGKRLDGDIRVSGAKNAALPLLAACLLAPGTHVIHRVPDLRDTRTILTLLRELGATSTREKETLLVNSDQVSSSEAPYDLVRTMRASILVLGPLVARFGKARVSLPGGCAIGARPINLHLKALEQMGAKITLDEGYVDVVCDRKLQGATIYFDQPTVTGTENILMAAVLAQGNTVLKNAAKEPEVGNLIDMLLAMGAKIRGKGTDRLEIEGVASLFAAEAAVIPDRIEAGTFLIIGAATGGEIRVCDCEPAHLPALIEKLRQAGVRVDEGEKNIRVVSPLPKQRITSVDIKTMTYPGFPTDLQAQFMALMALGHGTSVIRETIFENRFMHVAELKRLGANIAIDGNTAVVRGLQNNETLKGAPVMATDLRASASLVVAALAAQGRTTISRIYHLERGYECLAEKLSLVGADIKRAVQGGAG